MGAQVTIVANQIEKQRLGYQAVSLTNFAAATEPSVVAGSKIEVGGALFEFGTDETGTGWGGIGASNDVYFYVVPSGTSCTWAYSTTAPTWSTSKQGWYNGLNRCFGGCRKDGSGNYANKWIAERLEDSVPIPSGENRYRFVPMSGYTPAVGDVVQLNVDGTIRKAKRSAQTVVDGGSLIVEFVRLAALTDTKFVAVYAIGLVIYAKVGTVDLRTLSISWGSAQTVYTCTTNLSSFDVTEYDSSHVWVCYHVTGLAANQTYGRVLTVSGTTITVETAASGPAAGSNIACRQIPGSTNIVMTYLSATTTMGAVVVTLSGTTTTFNTPGTGTVTSFSFSRSNMHMTIASAGDLVVVAFGVSSLLRVASFTISGTTVAFVADYSTTIANLGAWVGIAETSPNCFTIINTGTAANGLVLVRRTTGGTIVAASSIVFGFMPNTSSYGDYGAKEVDRTKGIVLLMGACQSYDNSGYSQAWAAFARQVGGPGARALVEWEIGEMYWIGPSGVSGGIQPKAAVLSSGVVLIGTTQTSGHNYVDAIYRRNKIIGVAVDALGTVQLSGRCDGLSGLTIGEEYGVDANGGLTTAVGEVKIGVAVSDKTLLINVKPGI